MHEVPLPQAYLIGETALVDPADAPLGGAILGMDAFLDALGVPDWQTDAQSAGETLVEFYGRGCYMSFDESLNANLTGTTEGNEQFIQNAAMNRRHGSILEHAESHWMFKDVSRVLTHELVRHRIGVAISQQSLRFVRLGELGFYMPMIFEEMLDEDAAEKCKQEMNDAVVDTERHVRNLELLMDIDKRSFDDKKKLTSAIRRIAPIGLATHIGWSANMRTLRWVITERTSRHAEEEIRILFSQVAITACQRWPAIFADFEWSLVDGIREYTTNNNKV